MLLIAYVYHKYLSTYATFALPITLAVQDDSVVTCRTPLDTAVDLPACQAQRCVSASATPRPVFESCHATFVWLLKVVDLSSGFESESEGELPNCKRTPGGRAKRQRMTYVEDDSPGLDQDDAQVHLVMVCLPSSSFPCTHLQSYITIICTEKQTASPAASCNDAT